MSPLKFCLIFLILLSIACKNSNGIPAGQVGSVLPSFRTVDMNGNALTSADLRNKVVLIDFWATWCGPCRKEMPGYQKLHDRYASQGFVVIGFKVDMMAETEDPKKFIQELGIRYPIATGNEEMRNQFGGIQGLPTTLIFDRKGILRNKIVGFEYTEVVEKTIQQLL